MRGHDNQRELVAVKTEDSSEIRYQAKPIGLVSCSGQNLSVQKGYKILRSSPTMEEPSSSSEQSRYLPAKEDLYLLLSFYDTYIYYYTLKNILA
jgi:hypothetical protein